MAKFLKLCLAVLCLVATAVHAQETHVAAAADLTAALPAIIQQFENETHAKVVVSYGSSGNFYQQLQNNAPFDVFLSADAQYPQKLQDAGLTVPGTLTEYATGKIVLWTRNESKVDISAGLKGLTNPSIQKIAIANPQHAPYGKAAEAALKSEGIYDQISSKLVLGENISQTAVFAQTGNADVGIIALSLALNPTMKNAGHFVDIPTGDYPPIKQAVVVMKNSKNVDVAKKFQQFLSSSAARQVLQLFGFSVK
jgi:molybdate transport system substrate-binding protein